MVTALSTCRMGDCRSGPGKTHLIFHPLKDYPHNQPFWSCCPSISETQTLHMNELTGIEAEGWCQWRSVLLEVNIWGLVSVIPRMCKFTFPSPCSEPLTVLQWVCFSGSSHFGAHTFVKFSPKISPKKHWEHGGMGVGNEEKNNRGMKN